MSFKTNYDEVQILDVYNSNNIGIGVAYFLFDSLLISVQWVLKNIAAEIVGSGKRKHVNGSKTEKR